MRGERVENKREELINIVCEMSIERDERIDGEYDPPLPERIVEPTAKDKEKLKRLLEKYPSLKEESTMTPASYSQVKTTS